MTDQDLFIALGLALVVGLLFGIYPELDIKLAALFYDAATRSFPLKTQHHGCVRTRRRDVDWRGALRCRQSSPGREAAAAGPAAI